MRADYNERKKSGNSCQRAMLYVHGGAYYFGSVDEHRYQVQRHARKLRARVLAPEYRLAPQFPFPCGLQDCLAAYLFLITIQDPNTIIFAGDSAGGGMVLSMLVMIRDRGLPLPAGAILISPWVDLTHSFPSLVSPCPFDYIPQCGFHHKPSRAWPPPNEDELIEIQGAIAREDETNKNDKGSEGKKGDETLSSGNSSHRCVRVTLDGDKETVLKEQLQMYTTNDLLSHPMVSPLLYPTLGGLSPLFIIVGGGEILRDEQIYLAHKCANPTKYAPPNLGQDEQAKVRKYKPTDVQLQVWDDLCHVATTLSFTRPAKLMYRSIAQFGAWVLARAQNTGIDILDDDAISVISSSGSEGEGNFPDSQRISTSLNATEGLPCQVGRAGDPLPQFKNHMIRQRVSQHGNVFPLDSELDIEALKLGHDEIGVIKPEPVKKWLEVRRQHDKKYAATRVKIQKKRVREAVAGYETFGDGEAPPPSALVGRRPKGRETLEWGWTKHKSWGLALWSGWGSKHDEMAVEREAKAEQGDPMINTPAETAEGDLTRSAQRPGLGAEGRRPSHIKIVTDQHQTEEDDSDANRKHSGKQEEEGQSSSPRTPSILVVDMGASGKRPHMDGITMPFSIKKEADTASLMTLQSNMAGGGDHLGAPSPANVALKPQAPEVEVGVAGRRPKLDGVAMPFSLRNKDTDDASMVTLDSMAPSFVSALGGGTCPGIGLKSPKSMNEIAVGSPLARGVTVHSAGDEAYEGERANETQKKEDRESLKDEDKSKTAVREAVETPGQAELSHNQDNQAGR